MGVRRFTRLTNAFSKKFENHCAAVMLWFAFYNFCRVHKTLRVTPAMQAGIADHVWSVRELLEHSSPPMELLVSVKNLAKRRPKNLFPPEMALLMYYGSIAAAMVRWGKRITKLRDEDLRNGFTWAITQPWVPEKICELFRQAISQLSGAQNWRK